jgi:hypothetical protein
MSGITYDPPTEDVPIFDASLFVVDNVGLTTAQADLRYLKFPNAQGTENLSAFTASGTATLNGAVNVNGNAITARNTPVASTSSISLNPAPNSPFVTLTNTTETMTIYTSQATLSSDIQVQATKKLNIATTTANVDLNVGTGARTVSGVVHNYSDGDNCVAGSGVHLNNGVNNFSATNIHNGTSSSGSVNIMSGTGSGGNINIGSGSGSNPTITIGNEVTLNSTNNLYGNTTITKPFMDVISATTTSSTPSLFNNTLTGNVQIAQNQTGGTFSIGGGLNRDGSISIGQSTRGNILIGSTMTAGTNLITMGTSSLGTASVRGATVRLNDLGTGQTQISNPSGGAITIYKPLTVGYLPTAINSITQIGRCVEVFPPNLSLTVNGGDNIIATLTTGTAGVYRIDYSFRYGTSGLTPLSLIETWFNTSTQTGQVQYGNNAVFYNPAVQFGLICHTGSATITTTDTSTITFKCFLNYSGVAPFFDSVFSYYSYTRIA